MDGAHLTAVLPRRQAVHRPVIGMRGRDRIAAVVIEKGGFRVDAIERNETETVQFYNGIGSTAFQQLASEMSIFDPFLSLP